MYLSIHKNKYSAEHMFIIIFRYLITLEWIFFYKETEMKANNTKLRKRLEKKNLSSKYNLAGTSETHKKWIPVPG